MAASGHDVYQEIANLPADPGVEGLQRLQRQRFEQLARQKYQPYTRPRTANLSREDIMAADMARQTGTHLPHVAEAANIARAARTFPQAQEEYMNPYVNEVVNRMRDQGLETLHQNIMPALDAKFSRLGQFGSTAHQRELGKAARNIQNDIALQEYKARMMGYQNAAENFGRDRAHDIERANLFTKAALANQAGRESDIKALSERGQYNTQYEQMLKNVQYQDFLRHQAEPWDVLSKWVAGSNGIPYATSNTGMGIGAQTPVMNSAGSYGQIAASLLPLLFGNR